MSTYLRCVCKPLYRKTILFDYLIMIKWFIFKFYSNTIMKKGLIFILCRNMITTKGFQKGFKWDSGRKSCLVPHLAQPTSLNITRYNHFSTTLSTFSFVDITRQSYFLQLLWISESYFSTTSQEFPNFSISHPNSSQFFERICSVFIWINALISFPSQVQPW